jgi:hypothetical protein
MNQPTDREPTMTEGNWITLEAALIATLAGVVNVLLARQGTSQNERETWRRQEAGNPGYSDSDNDSVAPN